jgi:hypothetical protein
MTANHSNSNANQKKEDKQQHFDLCRHHSSLDFDFFDVNHSSTSGSPKKKDPAYMKLLGPDDKLLSQECERRITNGLCLLCGQKDHMADNCPKRTKPSNPDPTAARAANTITPPATGSITEITE